MWVSNGETKFKIQSSNNGKQDCETQQKIFVDFWRTTKTKEKQFNLKAFDNQHEKKNVLWNGRKWHNSFLVIKRHITWDNYAIRINSTLLKNTR